MRSLSSYLLLGAAGVQSVLGAPRLTKRAPIDDYISFQTPISIERVLCNIGPSGCEASGVPPGIAVASPSRNDPPYFFTWTRDSGLVFKNLAERFSNEYDTALQTVVQDFVTSQARLQTVSNPSGSLGDGRGLGEPKFEIDFRAYTEPWGRPQRDGPALRAIAIMQYAKWLVQNGYAQTAANICWPVIRNDINYVAQYWSLNGFDLWEEVNGDSFFTIANSYRAMIEASALAKDLLTTCDACDEVAPHILCFLQSFWDGGLGAIRANINDNQNRGDLDANTLLAAIHTFDPSLGCDSLTFQPCSDRMLANHKRTTDSMRVWPINNGVPQGSGPAVGRYVEDVYYNGNPWYLTTFAAAEVLYDAIIAWDMQGSLEVTSLSLDFFRDLDGSISTGTYSQGSAEYDNIINKVRDYADTYMLKCQEFTPSDGRMAEQYRKTDGFPLSARDLTWSYAAFLTASAARANTRSSTHGWAAVSPSLPGQCGKPTRAGSYAPSTITDWPSPIVVDGGSETVTGVPEICVVQVEFKAYVQTDFGDTVKVAGNVAELGNWDPNAAFALNADQYTADNPLWSGVVGIPPGTNLKFKLIKTTQNGDLYWEGGADYEWTPPGDCGSSVDYRMWWRFP